MTTILVVICIWGAVLTAAFLVLDAIFVRGRNDGRTNGARDSDAWFI